MHAAADAVGLRWLRRGGTRSTARLAGVVFVDQTPAMLPADGWDHGPIAALASDGSSVVIEDCGHVPSLEQPAKLARVIWRFVAEVTDP